MQKGIQNLLDQQQDASNKHEQLKETAKEIAALENQAGELRQALASLVSYEAGSAESSQQTLELSLEESQKWTELAQDIAEN